MFHFIQMSDILEGNYPQYGHPYQSGNDSDLLIKETLLSDAGNYTCFTMSYGCVTEECENLEFYNYRLDVNRESKHFT